MPNNVIELVVKVVDEATPALRAINQVVGNVATKALVGGAVLAGVAIRAVVKATNEAQAAGAKLDAAYKANGETLGRTREQLSALAKEIQRTTTFDDSLVESAEAILLTFDKVRGQAFERTLRAASDLSAMLGTDLVGATRLVGLALQDPERGLNALRRAGVAFDKDQREVIKRLIETGQVSKAQTVILQELESRIGGTANALRNTLGGALQALTNTYDDLLSQSTTTTEGLVEAINSITDTLSDPATIAAVQDFFGLFINLAEGAVKTVVGLGVILGIVGDESEMISRQLERLKELRFTLDSNNVLGVNTESIEKVDALMSRLSARQKEILKIGPNRKGEGGFVLPELVVTGKGPLSDMKEVLSDLQPIVVSSTKIVEKFGAELRDTETDAQSATRAYNKFVADLEFLLERDPTFTVEEYTKRLNAYLAAEIKPIEVKAKKIDLKPLQEFSAAANKIAEDIQAAFATVIRSILQGDSGRDILDNFKNAILEIPAQLAAQRLSEKMKEAILPKLDPFLDKIFSIGKKQPTAGAKTAVERAAEIVAGIKGKSTTSEADALCECICSCLASVRTAIVGSPGAVVDAVGKQTGVMEDVVDSSKRIEGTVRGVGEMISRTVVGVGRQLASAMVAGQMEGGSEWLQLAKNAVLQYFTGYSTGGQSTAINASGGGMKGGLVTLGEEGRETVLLPPGSRVRNQRQMAFAGAGGMGPAINIHSENHLTISGASDTDRTRDQLLSYLAMRDERLKRDITQTLRDNGYGRIRSGG